MKKIVTYSISVMCLLFVFLVNGLSAFATIPNQVSNGVYDEAGVLSEETKAFVVQLNEQLAQTKTKPQVAVLVVKSLGNETIESLALKTARQWKIGFSDTNNGALFAISINDRKMRLETTDAFATRIPDSLGKEIINLAREKFRDKNYDEGVQLVLTELSNTYLSRLDQPEQIQSIAKSYPTSYRSKKYKELSPLEFVIGFLGVSFALFVCGVSLIPRKYRRGSFLQFFNMFDGGSSGSGGSGGGWSGGGFSGGGSSSGW